jgi:hypothetical protein
MKVVIVGARLRSEPGDSDLVNKLIDGLVTIYGRQLFLITAGTDRGIGKIVRNRCLPFGNAKPVINFLDVAYRVYADDLPKWVFADLYLSRNHSLLAAGEEFHLFMDKDTRGHMTHLLGLVEDAGLPVSVYQLDGNREPKYLRA